METKLPMDQAARDRFRDEWQCNFAVAANAGSGKTTAISERIASMALSPSMAEAFQKTAVVTFTNKAANQIGQRARAVLLRRLASAGSDDLRPLDRLERAFFGTIHSFCLLLARRYGHGLGIHLSPTVIEAEDDAYWEEFLEQDPMQFAGLAPSQVDGFLRHALLDCVFDLARGLDADTAQALMAKPISPAPPEPALAVLPEILSAKTGHPKGAEALRRNKEAIKNWLSRFGTRTGFLPIPKPEGKAAGITDLYARFFEPLKRWLGDAGGCLAGELALRYRAWRFQRGIQTYGDQIEAAMAVLKDGEMLERVRAEGWRIILDEAQDTDPKQFSVLVEITRPPNAALGSWPSGSGPGPRGGHFCLVGDGQQGIYSTRADIRNFHRHLAAFGRGNGGELLVFDVTFRSPRRIASFLNQTLAPAFGPGREHNLGLPASDGAPAPLLQVPFFPMIAGPLNGEGHVRRLPLSPLTIKGADPRLAAEAREVASYLVRGGPGAVGAACWGDVCVLAPRNSWLPIIRREFEAAGLRTSLQMRKNRNGDNPVYAWFTGLLAAVCEREDTFEWVGVLREIFGVSDALIAAALAGDKSFDLEAADSNPEPLRGALEILRTFVGRADSEGEPLANFAHDLAEACGLRSKARLVDPDGGLETELERILALAARQGIEGGGPRALLGTLLRSIESGRPAGRPAADAINLLTSHSAKGLEWPVVIPMGLWRAIRPKDASGLRLVEASGSSPRAILDSDGLSRDTVISQKRERLRELVRLLYVTVTRPRNVLVLPWGAAQDDPEAESFAALWGVSGDRLAQSETSGPFEVQPSIPDPATVEVEVSAAPDPQEIFEIPRRILPHELAGTVDISRSATHEFYQDEPAPLGDGPDPLEYGLWWHGAMEHFPWSGDGAELRAYEERTLRRAALLGFSDRAASEWALFVSSPWLHLLRDHRWTRSAETAIFAPGGPGVWVDGVIDLVLHDPARAEVWIIDWKTNRRRTGEGDASLLDRLGAEYFPQLCAYATCSAPFFQGCKIRTFVYSTAAGASRELGPTAGP